MKSPIFNLILEVAAFLFGCYEIGFGFYAWRLNGFRFYITAGFLIGTPFLVVGLVTLLLPGQGFHSWEIFILITWLLGVSWKAWRKRRAKRDHPLEWAKWEAILRG